jgi:hypothetical protein
LHKLFHGNSDFPNLELVELQCYDRDMSKHKISIISRLDLIRLRTKNLHITLLHHENCNYGIHGTVNEVLSTDDVAAAVLPRFTVDSHKQVDTTQEWYTYKVDEFCRRHKTFVKIWPSTWDGGRATRWVVKFSN